MRGAGKVEIDIMFGSIKLEAEMRGVGSLCRRPMVL